MPPRLPRKVEGRPNMEQRPDDSSSVLRPASPACEQKPRYGFDSYLDWVETEGLRVFEDYAVDLFTVETVMWPRYGVKAAAVHLKGRGDFANMFVFDIPPGGAIAPQRHLYEDVVYVLEGTGSTQIEFADGRKKSFEW